MQIACQGVAGSYGHGAARSLYPAAKVVHTADAAAVVRAVLRGTAQLGIVPVANTIIGAIADGERALANGGVVVVNEIDYAVQHCLLALPGASLAQIRSVDSHPAALAQCARYIVAHGLAARRSLSTSHAAKAISADRNFSCAAIAGAEAAEMYGLAILDGDIADCRDNRTRFVVVAKAS